MPTFAPTAHTAGALRPTQGIARALGYAAQRYARYQAYTQTLNELRALSDRDLADLGMHRSGLKAIAAEAAAQKTA
jgi:uncharacterized protein YjiS (DUF1127 family)